MTEFVIYYQTLKFNVPPTKRIEGQGFAELQYGILRYMGTITDSGHFHSCH